MKNISEARDQSKDFSKATGADQKPVTTRKTTGIRIGERTIGQAELANADKAIQDAVGKLSYEANLLDEAERAKLEGDLGNRLGQFKEYMLRKSLELDKDLRQRGYDQAKRRRLLNILGGIGGGLAHSFVANAGRGGGAEPGASVDNMGAEGDFSPAPGSELDYEGE